MSLFKKGKKCKLIAVLILLLAIQAFVVHASGLQPITLNGDWVTIDSTQEFVVYEIKAPSDGTLTVMFQGDVNGLSYDVATDYDSDGRTYGTAIMYDWSVESTNGTYTQSHHCANMTYYCRIDDIKDKNVQFKVNFEPDPLEAPESIDTVERTRKDITISWSKVDGAVGYHVYLKKNGKDTLYKKVTDTKIKVTGLTVEKEYTFGIATLSQQADGSVIESDVRHYTETTKMRIPNSTKITSIKKIGADGPRNYYMVKWKKAKYATKYALYGKFTGGSWQLIKTTKKTSYPIYANRGFSYKLKVVAKRYKNGRSTSAKASKVKTFRSK